MNLLSKMSDEVLRLRVENAALTKSIRALQLTNESLLSETGRFMPGPPELPRVIEFPKTTHVCGEECGPVA